MCEKRVMVYVYLSLGYLRDFNVAKGCQPANGAEGSDRGGDAEGPGQHLRGKAGCAGARGQQGCKQLWQAGQCIQARS